MQNRDRKWRARTGLVLWFVKYVLKSTQWQNVSIQALKLT